MSELLKVCYFLKVTVTILSDLNLKRNSSCIKWRKICIIIQMKTVLNCHEQSVCFQMKKKNNELRMIYEIYYDVFLKQTFFTQIRT